MQNRYDWVATKTDGTTFDVGGDLNDVVMFSLVPQTPLLPQHDFIGVKFKHRFCRGFLNAMGGGMKDYVHCIVCDAYRIYVKYSNGSVLITPPDYELYL